MIYGVISEFLFFICGVHVYGLLHTCIIMSSEPDAESWDSGMIMGVVVMAILFTLIGSLLFVFILEKLFNS